MLNLLGTDRGNIDKSIQRCAAPIGRCELAASRFKE
jgi:hypothetical protein